MTKQQKRAAIYARIATLAQIPGESDFALETQIAQAKAYCQEHGYSVSEQHLYQEVSSGSAYKNRPEFSRLTEAAKQREFAVVVIIAYDRIARNSEQVRAFIAEMETCGVSVETIRDAFPGSAFERFALYAPPAKEQPGDKTSTLTKDVLSKE